MGGGASLEVRMRSAPGVGGTFRIQIFILGNPGGSPEATRRAFNKRFLLDLAAVDGDGSNWSSGPGHWALRSHAASLTVMGDRFKKLK